MKPTEPKQSALASEGGHWYALDGSPRYEYTTQKGEVKPVTLRQARPEGWVPSVTTIWRVRAEPGLVKYFQRQMHDATHTTKRNAGETDDDYFDRCLLWAKEHSKDSANAGTGFHASMEAFGRGHDVPFEHRKLVAAVDEALKQVGVDLKNGDHERSFACPELGYGGKCDCHSAAGRWLVDFKTKAVLPPGRLVWASHQAQCAAYSYGLGLYRNETWPACHNVFIGLKTGEVRVETHSDEHLDRGWKMFRLCLDLWQLENNYFPGEAANIDNKLAQAGL